MTEIPRYAIVVTHNRHELLFKSVVALNPQVDLILVIDNASDPPVSQDYLNVDVLHVEDQPPNLSRFWNLGFDYIADRWMPTPQWNVAVLCDDVIVPEGWYDAVSSCMRQNGAAAGSTHQWNPVTSPILKTVPDNDLANRMCGWAFVLAGEKGLRADESMSWWYCDTDLDWQARANGGMVICPGPVAHNIHPNDWTARRPELNHQSGQDGLTFARKHGGRPW